MVVMHGITANFERGIAVLVTDIVAVAGNMAMMQTMIGPDLRMRGCRHMHSGHDNRQCNDKSKK
jgi:hypothetical protein